MTSQYESYCHEISDWQIYIQWLCEHNLHPIKAQAEVAERARHVHFKPQWTCTFGYLGSCSTPTIRDTHYYTLFIDDYTMYTSHISRSHCLPRPPSHFRPELTESDMGTRHYRAIRDGENMTIRPSDMSLCLTVYHMSHALHTLTISIVLPNSWSVKPLKTPRR